LRDYDQMWRQEKSAHYSASKEGLTQAWSKLQARLETEEYTLREDNPYKGSPSSALSFLYWSACSDLL